MLDILKAPVRPLVRKLREARRYSRLGHSLTNRLKLAIIGYYHLPEFKTNFNLAGQCLLGSKGLLTVQPSMLKGKSVSLETSDWAQIEIFHELFALNVYDLSEVPFIPDLILDCGGHIGLFTVLAGSAYPTAISKVFEPNPKNLELIGSQIKHNGLSTEVVPNAVSDYEGEEWFTVPASPGGRLESTASIAGERFRVRVIDLVEELKRLKPNKLLLKVDIEGEEARLLPALIPHLPETTALYFETHDGPVTWDALTLILEAHRFKVRLIRGRDPYRDGFACRTGTELPNS